MRRPGRPVAAQSAPPAALASSHPAYGDVRLGGRYIHVWNPGGSSAGGARSQGVQTAVSAPCRVSPCQLSYKGGPVLTTANLYTIFWLPPGWHFERTNDGTAPNAADTRYETLINQFLGDLQGSTYYNILRQYSDAPSVNGASGEFLTSPNIQDAVTLAGSAVVTDTLPTDTPPCNGGAAGASLNDIETEVVNVIQAHNWPPAILGSDGFTETIPAGYLLYTPFGLDIGQANNGVGFCSDLAFGAYHTNTIAPIYGTPYAAMCDINGDAQGAPTPAPATGDPFVDNETPASAHELAEMVTDPVPPVVGRTLAQKVSFPIFSFFPRGAYTLSATATDTSGDGASGSVGFTVT